jgi:hypothetical protein
MRALHYGQPDRRPLAPDNRSCHFGYANDTRSRLLDVEGALYQGYFAATPVKIMGQIRTRRCNPFMWAQVNYRIGDSMTIEIPTNSRFQKEGQVPFDVLSVDLPLFHPKRRRQRSTSWDQTILPALQPLSCCCRHRSRTTTTHHNTQVSIRLKKSC